jgi:hypothetical protein
MPWNYGISAQFYDINPLKYTSGNELAKAVVIDANQITLNADPNQRTVVSAGTIMKISPGNAKQVMPYNSSGTIVGILKRSVDISTNATKGNEPAAVYWHGAIFATQFVVGFTAYSAALITALPGCKFE